MIKKSIVALFLVLLTRCGGSDEQEFSVVTSTPYRPKSDVSINVTMPKVIVGSDSIVGSYMLILVYKDSTGRYVGQIKDFGF